MNLLKIFVFFSFTILSLSAQSSESEKIYKSILKATFTNDKIEIAQNLLKKNECKEGKYILKLMKDSHYWNRETGVFLVGECKNPNLDKAVCDLFLEDHMTQTAIRELIKKQPNRFAKHLVSLYKQDLWDPTKRELFKLYELTQDADTSNFLQGLIKNPKSPDRTLAFQSLLKHKKDSNDSFVRSFLNDKELRKYSLQWLTESGNKSDLKLFQEILSNPNSELEELASACIAIKKWGDEKEKKETYLRFLKEDTQRLLPSLFSIFNDLLDEDIFKEIGRLSRAGKTQFIRTEAVLQLKNSSGSKKYPYIILFLQEEYQAQNQNHPGDTIATLMTFGLHSIFKGLEESKRKDKFYSIKSELIQFLQKETGENFKTATQWKVWANQKKLLPISIIYE
ncbi:MAG: hypothetical protein KBF93_19370 [Leptospiraceae bacterium]|nr:hypothetical protein [Leptospiraceae bacterium]